MFLLTFVLKMEPTNIKAYKVVAYNKVNRSTLICVTFRFDSNEQYFGDFIELVSTFDNSSFKIPTGRNATFQEELRVNAKAVVEAPKDTWQIENWIEKEMKNVYGADLKVIIEDFGNSK